MEYRQIADTGITASRIALGTWAIGGWMWGGTETRRSIETIHTALEKGVTLIDTAPVYGFGTSEKIVGKALEEYGDRDNIRISTKAGLEWDDDENIRRNGSRDRIRYEIDKSLERLGTTWIDVYFVHWPDCSRDVAETATAMRELHEEGIVKAVGVSNFTVDQMQRFMTECPLHACQPPYNIFERGIENDVKPFCERHGIALMTYGALCRGLLSGKMTRDREFEGDDLRNEDPKFAEPRFSQYLESADKLEELAGDRFGKSILAFSLRWILEQGVDFAIWGSRRPSQLDPIDEILGWSMDLATMSAVDGILAECIEHPVGPEFMAPPTGVGTED